MAAPSVRQRKEEQGEERGMEGGSRGNAVSTVFYVFFLFTPLSFLCLFFTLRSV